MMILKRAGKSFKKNKGVRLVSKKRCAIIIIRKTITIGFIIILLVLSINFVRYLYEKYSFISEGKIIFEITNLSDHNKIVNNYFEMRKYWKTSNLGSLLFKNEKYDVKKYPERNKNYIILVWKHWKWLRTRHVDNFSRKKTVQNILKSCTVNNCVITEDNSTIEHVDAVLVHVRYGMIPNITKRNKKQIWIFLNDDSPNYAFSRAKIQPNLRNWTNIFNWSMSYRSNSDIPVPYGRTVSLKKPVYENATYDSIADLIPNLHYKRQDVLVTVVLSSCKSNGRNKYLEDLQKHIEIDIIGKCSKENNNRCPDHFTRDCKFVGNYYFYLVMENSMCRQYLSEKVFQHAYSKGAIPILVGPSLHDCRTLLPPNSYIHAEDFMSHKELAAKIKSIVRNNKEFFSFHAWRNHFKVLNEHGYFGTKSLHLCRLCQALNYNDEKQKIYQLDDLRLFLDRNVLCKYDY